MSYLNSLIKKSLSVGIIILLFLGFFIPTTNAHTLTNMFAIDSNKEYDYGIPYNIRWIQDGFGQTYYNSGSSTYLLLNALFQFKVDELENGESIEFPSIGKTGKILAGVNAEKIFSEGSYRISTGYAETVGFFVYIDGDIYFFPSDSTFENSKNKNLNPAYKVWDKNNRIIGDGLFIFITMRYDLSMYSPGRSVMQIFSSGDFSNTYVTKIEEYLLPTLFKSTLPGTFSEEEKGLMPFLLRPSPIIYYNGISQNRLKPYYSSFTPVLFPSQGWNHYTQYNMIPAFWHWIDKDDGKNNYLTNIPIHFVNNSYFSFQDWGGMTIDDFGKNEDINFLRWYRLLYRSDDFYKIESSPVTTGIINYFSNGKYTYSDHSSIGNKPEEGNNTGNIPIKTGYFSDCEGFTDIGCYVKGGFSMIFDGVANIWTGFSDIIKGIFNWAIDTFITPIFKPIYDFFSSNIEDLKKISFTGTMATCQAFQEVNQEEATIASNIANFISLAIPFAPEDTAEICTLDGRKIVDYQDNTKFLDTILVLIAFSSVIFTFISGNPKHD